MTAFVFFLGWGVLGLIGFFLNIYTVYFFRDVDLEDLFTAIFLWILGPIGLLVAISYWTTKIGYRYKVLRRKS